VSVQVQEDFVKMALAISGCAGFNETQ